MEIKFIVNPQATECLAINLWSLNMPTIHIIIDASGGLCLLHYETEIETLTACPAIYKMVNVHNYNTPIYMLTMCSKDL